jgi:hypothetical protein
MYNVMKSLVNLCYILRMRISIITLSKVGKDPSTIPSFCLEDGRYHVKIYKIKKDDITIVFIL